MFWAGSALGAALVAFSGGASHAADGTVLGAGARTNASAHEGERLIAPSEGDVLVAFVLSAGATVIDFTGPWEVFQDVVVPGRGNTPSDTWPFRLFTVAESRQPIRASGGLQIVPDYTFADAPQPRVIVVPAQGPGSPAVRAWLEQAAEKADLTMSVCAGAFLLGESGLLDGQAATTHHDFLDRLEQSFPRIVVRRDVRFVEGPRLASAAGLTSGIDLALRVVERYFGADVAARTARNMEYESEGWHASRGVWDAGGHALAPPTSSALPAAALRGYDPVHLTEGREVPGSDSISLIQGRYRYCFSTEETRKRFRANPRAYEIQLQGACAFMASTGAGAGGGDPNRYLVYNKRIYIFASEDCRDSFRAAPEKYLTK